MDPLHRLISPSGELSKAWLAAHWERRLRRSDFVEADLCKLIDTICKQRALVSLRAVGHLLLGVCKIFQRKSVYLEEEAQELKTKLTLVFTHEQVQPKDKDKGVAAAADRDVALSAAHLAASAAAAAEALQIELHGEKLRAAAEEALVHGKRHTARIEDITLKDRPVGSPKLVVGPSGNDDLFGTASHLDLDAELQQLQGILMPEVPPDLDVDFETQPLVALERLAVEEQQRPPPAPLGVPVEPAFEPPGEPFELIAEEGDTPMPLVLDLEGDDSVPGRAGGLFATGAAAAAAADAEVVEEDLEGELEAEALAEDAEQVAKRRRRVYCEFDERTEIPAEEYNRFTRDRSAITRKHLLDYTVTLPHTTSGSSTCDAATFMGLCPALRETLEMGRQAVEKRRRLQEEREAAEYGIGEDWHAGANPFGGPNPFGSGAASSSSAAVAAPAEDVVEAAPGVSVADAMAALDAEAPWEGAGDARGGAVVAAAAVPLEIDDALLKDAPRCIAAVVEQEEQNAGGGGLAVARLGYSARTEKMHRYLAREFHSRNAQKLSYESMCRRQGRRDIAAGFFELLVLQSEGVIALSQENPRADISISREPVASGAPLAV